MRKAAVLVVSIAILFHAQTALAGRVFSGLAYGVFWANCFYAHSAKDDPIMMPGQPGGSRLHDFFGNRSTNARSTQHSMSSGRTGCDIQGDRSGYWSPAAYLGGVRLPGMEVRAYYLNFFADAPVHTIPVGLQMIGGNREAASASENPHTFWSCGANSPHVTHPYECTGYGDERVVGGIDFPSCWDGNAKGMEDVVYPATPRTSCPDEFPIELPILSLRIHLGIVDPCAGRTPCGPDSSDANVRLSLSSGRYYTLHADFWNLWSPAVLKALVHACLNAHRDCGQRASDPTIPPPPVLQAGRFGARRVHLQWTASGTGGATITGYRIYRSVRPAAENGLGRPPIAVLGHVTSFVDSNVRSGTRYFYRVSATNSVGVGGLSDEASVSAR
jgi:hypothetical protein